MKTEKAAFAGVWGAVIFLLTYFVHVPTLVGYIHMGDAFVILSGVYLGGIPGAIASAIGSSLADLLAGYGVYIPVTFLLKGSMALLAVRVFGLLKKQNNWGTFLLVSLPGEVLMIAVYFLYEWLLYGVGGAIPGLFSNVIQGVVSVLFSCLFGKILYPLLTRFFKKSSDSIKDR